MSRDRADGPDGKSMTPPEAESPEEAALLRAWAEGLEEAEELPEEILGLLDGTLSGPEADAVRRRLAEDPSLARAAGSFAASLRETVPGVTPEEAPPKLFAEAADRVPVEEPTGSWAERFRSFLRAARFPAAAAVGAAALLVTFVLQERQTAPPPVPTLRSADPAPLTLALTAPDADARVRGDLTLRWEAVEGALRYRVVLVDSEGGEVFDAGHTETTALTAEGDRLAEHFGAETSRALHGIVRARLLDGSEISSAPRRIVWSAN